MLGTVVVAADGSGTATVTVPSGSDRGRQVLTASAGSGDDLVSVTTDLVVQGGPPAGRGKP